MIKTTDELVLNLNDADGDPLGMPVSIELELDNRVEELVIDEVIERNGKMYIQAHLYLEDDYSYPAQDYQLSI